LIYLRWHENLSHLRKDQNQEKDQEDTRKI